MVDLLVILVILAAVVVFVTAPLRRAPDAVEPIESGLVSTSSRVGELEAARDAKLRELRDAELDHRTGKLSDEDFQALDCALRQEAIEILRELDEAREQDGSETDPDTATITEQ